MVSWYLLNKFNFNFTAHNTAPAGLIRFPEYDDFCTHSVSDSQQHVPYEHLSPSNVIQNSHEASDPKLLTDNSIK